ncbi:NADPH-dependent 7-cyano-7-deazaguanine reductase QueF [Candidatus Sumerlaeota bacterium]|nr:NADPH-dependent 7-cyano-7-deazaguanine reductase QueF [Candidatus Sumerlaeota bacterium]
MDFEAQDKKLPFDGPDKIDVAVLETFDYEYAGKDAEIEIQTDEFTSVCPYSGLPDFASIVISYVPDQKCIELRSLKYYLLSYRNVGIFYEHLVNRMLDDLAQCCQPNTMTIRGEFTIRGGLQSVITASYPR